MGSKNSRSSKKRSAAPVSRAASRSRNVRSFLSNRKAAKTAKTAERERQLAGARHNETLHLSSIQTGSNITSFRDSGFSSDTP